VENVEINFDFLVINLIIISRICHQLPISQKEKKEKELMDFLLEVGLRQEEGF